MPDSYPEWPNGSQVHSYLTEYAKDYGLMPRMRFNSTVVGMRRRNSGIPGWLLEIQNSDGNVTREEFDFVAVCTGQFNEPQTISHPGEDASKAGAARFCIPRSTPMPPSSGERRSSSSADRNRQPILRSIPS